VTAQIAPERATTDENSIVAAVEDLHVTFRRNGSTIHALRGVSLDIREGEILGLVGESGSGKSVMGLTLLGLHGPGVVISGRATVRGRDMVTASGAERRQVRIAHLGAVFQDPMTSLNPTMRVGKQVAESAGSDEEALRLLKLVGIPEAERRMSAFPHELSGGLRQRVMIAMAVAGNPDLVIADEPTTALDVTVQAQVLELLRTLRDELGCSVLMITHDLGVAAQIADRVAVMYAGRLAEIGQSGTVLQRAAHPYTLGLMRSRLTLGADRTRALPALAGEVPSPAAPRRGCAFSPRCSLAGPDCEETMPVALEVESGNPSGHLSACLRPLDVVRESSTVASHTTVSDAELIDDMRDVDTAIVDTAIVDIESSDESGVDEGTPALALRSVVKTFSTGKGFGRRRSHGLQALRGVSLRIAQGESVALVGESGSGKSTLLRVAAGLESADSGEVELAEGARPQMVFQDAGASLTPWMTVEQILGERVRNLGRSARAAKVREALTLVGLPHEAAAARAGQLSGGQRQRVCLARATIVPPPILLCDEPTSALDVSLAASVINLIGRLRRELGMSVLFVTHDLSVARVVADRIAVMYLGQIVEIGEADRVTTTPLHPYTRALVGAVPDVGVTPTILPGDPASPLNPPTGCAFHPRCSDATDWCRDPDLVVRLHRITNDDVDVAHDDVDQVACINLTRGPAPVVLEVGFERRGA
jgi:peptide/nickel transport system ATP-binding protein